MAYILRLSSEPIYLTKLVWEDPPPGWQPPLLHSGKWKDPNDVPKRAVLKSRHKKLPDFFQSPGALVISKAVREAIESLEPNVHQFFPVEIVLRGEVIKNQYFLLNVLQTLKAIVIDRSNVKPFKTDFGRLVYHMGPGPFRVVVRRDVVSGKHLWWPGEPIDRYLYCSDKLMELIKQRKLKKMMANHVEEV